MEEDGCYDDVKNGVRKGNGQFFEFGNASRDISDIQNAINLSKEKNVDLLIGAGGASVMDATKIISVGNKNPNYFEIIKKETGYEGLPHLPLSIKWF